MSRFSIIAGSAVLLTWAVTMGFLLKNHYFTAAPEVETGNIYQSVKPVEKWHDVIEYMTIKRDGNSLGSFKTTVVQLDKITSGAQYQATLNANAKAMSGLPQLKIVMAAQLDKEQNLKRFYANADLGITAFTAQGEVDHQILYIKTSKFGKINKVKVRIPHPLTLTHVVRSTMPAHLEIKQGADFSTAVVNPMTGVSMGSVKVIIGRKEAVEVQGQKVNAYRVTSNLNDIETVAWVDKQGTVLKRQLVGNIYLEKSTQDAALAISPELDASGDIPPLNLADFNDVPLSEQQKGSRESLLENQLMNVLVN